MKKFLLCVVFVLTYFVSFAQNSAWTIPGIIYVGDPAVLILPLPGQNQDFHDVILTPHSPDFPYDPDIDFHRIELERRISAGRLLIEFTAFVPGLLVLPAIQIGGERFDGLSITVNSIIHSTGSALELSRPASSLAIPGTALMFYGILVCFVLLIFLIIWFILKGRVFMQVWTEKWKRWRAFASIKNTEKRLQKALLKGENKRAILDKLSDEFRKFLSFLTGENCRSMTAREFELLPDIFSGNLGNFFRCCDKFRFSGVDVKSEDIAQLLADLRAFLEKINMEQAA